MKKFLKVPELIVLVIVLFMLLLLLVSFADLGFVSFISFWILIRWLPILIFIRVYVDIRALIFKIKTAETKKEKAGCFTLIFLGIVICSGLLFLMSLPA